MSSPPELLVVVRHAESARNVAKGAHVFYPNEEARRPLEGIGDHDIGLSAPGEEQARTLGDELCRQFERFDLVIHSGYRRARDTAAALLEAWPAEARSAIEVREHVFLRERDTGYTFNMTEPEARDAFPWLQEYWSTTGPFFGRPPGGESLADVAVRVGLFFQMREADLAGRRVLLVTHAGTQRIIRYLVEGRTHGDEPERWRNEPAPNAHYVVYRARAGRLELE